MYLQPIFDSPDIMKQLPTEGLRYDDLELCVTSNWLCVRGKKFRLVDSKWRQASDELLVVQAF